MPKVIIELSSDQHRQLLDLSEQAGKSVSDFMIEKAMDSADPLEGLRAFLAPRIERAKRGERSSLSFEQIKHKARQS